MSEHAPIPPANAFRRAGLLVSGLLFGGLLLLGLVHSLLVHGRPPGVRRDYVDGVNVHVTAGRFDEALRQMRVAVVLDGDSETVRDSVLPTMARLAGDLGRREDRLFALRAAVDLDRRDPQARVRLAGGLLEADALTLAELREAADHAEIAVKLDPGLGEGWFHLGRVAEAVGQAEQARNLQQRAEAIDPSWGRRDRDVPAWKREESR